MKLLCTVYVCVLTQYEYTHAHPSLLSYSPLVCRGTGLGMGRVCF